mmetsp:Transcript_9852/g.28938  ORF Transcript_9852/g.28938 Transcript_9852/m.28938 type:complete len:381 (-) Transcript_9852:863-2005(-)
MDDAARGRAEGLLVQNARDKLAGDDLHHRVRVGEPFVLCAGPGGGLLAEVDVGQVEGDRLLASPERPRLEDRGRGQLAVPLVQVQAESHHHVPLEEAVALGEAPGPEERVLHDAHHGFVGLGAHDAPRHEHDLRRLRASLHGLRHVEVHLVAVKVGVVGGGHREVEAEGGVGHDLDAVRHDGHLVQRGLAVEEHHVAVLEVALHAVAHLEVTVRRPLGHLEVPARAVGADDVARARQVVGSIVHELLQARHVERRHHLGVGEGRGDGPRHAHLVDGQVGVRGDHGARGKVHTLAHEVAAHAPVLALEPLGDGLEGSPRLGSRLTRHHGRVVGDDGRVVVLKQLGELRDDVRGRALLLVAHELVVGLDHVRELVREVVLGP